MGEISKITVAGNEYGIKDETARAMAKEASEGAGGGMKVTEFEFGISVESVQGEAYWDGNLEEMVTPTYEAIKIGSLSTWINAEGFEGISTYYGSALIVFPANMRGAKFVEIGFDALGSYDTNTFTIEDVGSDSQSYNLYPDVFTPPKLRWGWHSDAEVYALALHKDLADFIKERVGDGTGWTDMKRIRFRFFE